MASAFCRNLVTVATKFVQTRNLQIPVASLGSKHFHQNGVISRNVTRSLWHFTKSKDITGSSARAVGLSKICSCGVHSEVDTEISKFLEKEIKFEESSKSLGSLPKIQGFDIKTDGSDVTLTKTIDSEKVTVTFNINGTVDSESPDVDDSGPQGKDEGVQMVSRPPFTVEIQKGDSVLGFQCGFSPMDEQGEPNPADDPDVIIDQFEIQEVAMHSGDWKDNTYSLPADTMDGTLYDLMMDLLDERGINDEFIGELVEFSTAYEQGKYVSFMKSLKSFVEKS